MLYTVVTVHLVLEQTERLAPNFPKVHFHERDARVRHLRHPICHITNDGHVFRYTQSLTGDSLNGRDGQQPVGSQDGIRRLWQTEQLQRIREAGVETDMVALYQFGTDGNTPFTQSLQIAVLTV